MGRARVTGVMSPYGKAEVGELVAPEVVRVGHHALGVRGPVPRVDLGQERVRHRRVDSLVWQPGPPRVSRRVHVRPSSDALAVGHEVVDGPTQPLDRLLACQRTAVVGRLNEAQGLDDVGRVRFARRVPHLLPRGVRARPAPGCGVRHLYPRVLDSVRGRPGLRAGPAQ